MTKFIQKPWGHELIWASGKTYVGKVLFIKAGHQLSRQYHEKKEETILVKSGILHVEECGTFPHVQAPKIIILKEGDTFHVSPMTIHRFKAVESNVEIIEVSSIELDDVVRLQDDYKRKTIAVDVELKNMESANMPEEELYKNYGGE